MITDMSILDKGPTQGLNDTKLTAETQYSIDSTIPRIKFFSSLHFHGSNNFLCANATKISSKQKNLK